MPKIVDTARVTTPTGSVWRACQRCGRLAALPPGTVACPGCSVLDLADLVVNAADQMLAAIDQHDGALFVAILDRVRREVSPVIADRLLEGLVTSGRLTTTITPGGAR